MGNHGEYLHEVRLGRNKKYHFIGQLLQGRYRSEIIDNDSYFLATNRYILLNPVKAGMVERPLE